MLVVIYLIVFNAKIMFVKVVLLAITSIPLIIYATLMSASQIATDA